MGEGERRDGREKYCTGREGGGDRRERLSESMLPAGQLC